MLVKKKTKHVSPLNTWENDANQNIEKAETNLYFSGMLTKDEYFLLTLVAMHGYSTAEAARVFDITAEACRKRVQRIKKKLKKLLDENI